MGTSPIEQRLGYAFASDDLLLQALTHRSFGSPHNERLEFLGDSVLSCRISAVVYEKFLTLPEGDLSRIRSNLVNQASLARIANDLGLSGALRLGDGELRAGGAFRASILADAFEALLGAVYLDGGFDAAAAVIDRFFLPLIADRDGPIQVKDPKTRLQEWLQGHKEALPEYRVARIEGAQHQQNFVVECKVVSRGLVTRGEGGSRRIAEQKAAAEMLDRLAAPAARSA
jgi:ribonuclease-3